MNNQGQITDHWADGVYSFRLTFNGVIELEQKCEAPFAIIFGRLTSGAYTANDIRETIRIGLIGGGTKAADALKLVDRYILPLAENLPVAQAIVAGAMFGFKASPLGNQQAAPTEKQPPSTPPPSLEHGSPLEAIFQAWTEFPSGSSRPQ